MCMYIYVYTYVYIIYMYLLYVYIYKERERENALTVTAVMSFLVVPLQRTSPKYQQNSSPSTNLICASDLFLFHIGSRPAMNMSPGSICEWA